MQQSAISPPVFDIGAHRSGPEGNRAVAVEVPGSVDGPHLIPKNDLFGAPARNDADTVWMKEQQIEAMYRARFDECRWLIAVAHPRIPRFQSRLTCAQARDVLKEAARFGLFYAGQGGMHPLKSVERLNPRPGLRRWVAIDTAHTERSAWKEAGANIHHDGLVAIFAEVGGHRVGMTTTSRGRDAFDRHRVRGRRPYGARLYNGKRHKVCDECQIQVGIECTGKEPFNILTIGNHGYLYDDVATILHRYIPVENTVKVCVCETDPGFYSHIHDQAQDCVNQS